MKKTAIAFGVMKVLFDFLCTVLAFLIARQIRTFTDLIPGVQLPIGFIPEVSQYLPFVFCVSVLLVLLFAFNGMYSFLRRFTVQQELVRVILYSSMWIMLVIAYFFLIHEYFFSRLVLLYGWLMTILFLIGYRLLLQWLKRWFVSRGIGVTRVLFVGDGNMALELASLFHHNANYHVIGILTTKHEKTSIKTLGTIAQLEEICTENNIDEVIQTSSLQSDVSLSILDYCRTSHIRYRFIPDMMEVQRANVEIREENGIPIIELKPTPLDGWGRVLKRIVDVVGSILIAIILFPFILGTAIAVWVQLKGFRHIIFKHKRLGLQGKPFTFYKFQSMRLNAEKEHVALLEQHSERSGLLKLKNDSRVTPVGRFIRRTSLDELPQLWNILKGDMSLVGPRPHMPSEVERFSKQYYRVLTIKPGITGMAQVNGRSDLDFEDEIRLDLSYIENWSFWLDIMIILKTVLVVLKRKNVS